MQHAHALWQHQHHFGLGEQQAAERRTYWVIAITLVTMVVELIVGYTTGSMALTADGWHMGTHAAALGLTAFTYVFARRHASNPRFTFGSGKAGPLGGFASAIALSIVSLLMAIESLQRLVAPIPVEFSTALLVAVTGLVVNLLCAWLLGGAHDHGHGHAHGHAHDHHEHHAHHAHHDHDTHHAHDDHHDHDAHHAHDDHHAHDEHHDHQEDSAKPMGQGETAAVYQLEHQDHNLRGAYLHVLADALTSLTAIVALICGMTLGWVWMDPLMGVVGSVVIAVWAYGLIRNSAKTLLDAEDNQPLRDHVAECLRAGGDCEITDLHVWRVGPLSHACIVSLVTHQLRSADEYKVLLKDIAGLDHILVEVNHCRSCA
ncbi:cation diffusion facilitator family transporter [Candidatus Magnetaquicoccus inordinatus]|uniref:cation diffusion facilitator family transporter n=1 Tax=Candidatus Magnetaquicoccus inordinatus TaxID=2496818 RepID=UPI00102AEC5D|nr:cation diffusion facilitator family transporter [Candidatus Magnetaquicoccus inordinatus]